MSVGRILAVALALTFSSLGMLVSPVAAAPGDRDTSFSTGGFDSDLVFGAEPLPDGDVYIYGAFKEYVNPVTPVAFLTEQGIIRLDSTGRWNSAFQVGDAFNLDGVRGIKDVAVLPGGDLIVVGTFTSYDGASREGIARLDPDGSLDTSLVPPSGGFQCQVSGPGSPSGCSSNPADPERSGPRDLEVLPDGDLLVAGGFDHYGTDAVTNVVRINPDGSRDTGFDPGTGTDNPILALALEGGGATALIGGRFGQYDTGPKTQYLARINAATGDPASPDLVQGTGFEANVDSVAVRDDGQIIVGGGFTSYDGSSRVGIALLQPDGQLAAGSVNPSVPAARVASLAIGQDGKVLAGLSTNLAPVPSQKSPFRLLANGAIDPSFGTGVGVGGNNPTITSLAPASDGSVWVTGSFTQYDGQPADPIVDSSVNHVTKVLNVRKLDVARTGQGSVTSAPAGISCGSRCSYWFDQASSVTLTATPASGRKFTGWSGACSGTGPCTVSLTEGKSAKATFVAPPAKPKVKWASSKRKRTVEARVRRVAGVTYSLTARKGSQTKTGRCRPNKKTKRIDCTVKLRKGSWLASVTPKANGVTGTPATKRFRFR